jgi:U2 small nuclear ribonucleoprotein A'
MRISAELLGLAEQRPNAVGERELVLRGIAIPAIEHLAATRDAFDAIDFTDNRISRLENFPRLQRLSHLMLSGNVIESVDAKNMAKNVPNLQHLELAFNHISSLREVANLGKACPKLESLSLVGNSVTRKFGFRSQAKRHFRSGL